VGKTLRVMVEEIADRYPDQLLGTADNTRSVLFTATEEQKKELMGKFVTVKINDYVSPHMVRGELVEVLG